MKDMQCVELGVHLVELMALIEFINGDNCKFYFMSILMRRAMTGCKETFCEYEMANEWRVSG